MLTAVFAFAGSLLAAIAFTPAVRSFALALGAVDQPGERRVHARAVPRLGGLAIVFAFFAALVAVFLAESEVARIFFVDPVLIAGLIAGGLLVCALGVLDDVKGLRAWHKLCGQGAVAVVAYACGFRIDAVKLPFLGNLDMGVFGVVVTALWIVAIINAINLIDGLDGLAGGVAFFACVTNFVVATINNDVTVMLLSGSLGGAVLGFLLFNFSPASIFMGDSGSMFLGFVLATTSILGNSVKSSTTVAILVPFVALGLPIIDTLLAMLRRFLERRSIFTADRGHIHHQLLAMGLTHRRAVLLLYALSVLFTASSIIVSIGRNAQVGAALVVITIAVIGLLRALGNLDGKVRSWLRKQRIRPAVVERMRRDLPWLLGQIDGARELADLLPALKEFAGRVELDGLELTDGSDGTLSDLRWSRPRSVARFDGELPQVDVVFPVSELGAGANLQFTWTQDTSEVGADAEVLLQLVADAIGARVASGKSARRRDATSGHLRPI